MPGRSFSFYEFFAGGGMARAGLGAGWTCRFANDIDPDKAASYRANWGGDEFFDGDLGALAPEVLPGVADLAWASFPCQDLSLAGGGKGMGGADDEVRTRSGAFWLFHDKIRHLRSRGRAPRAIVLENVVGVLTSHGKRDFQAIVAALDALDYRVGALVVNASRFTPQSRPRVFFVALAKPLFAPCLAPVFRRCARRRLEPARLARGAGLPRLAFARSRHELGMVASAPPARRNIHLADILEGSPRTRRGGRLPPRSGC